MGAAARERLLDELSREIPDQPVLSAMAAVDRACFVPPDLRERAWENRALPIDAGQTISQPLVVAHMCSLLELRPTDRVLDVGTGSGYHAAVLAALGEHVWSIERHAELSALAAGNLARAGVANVTLVVGDGTLGHAPAAPYDAVNVAASSDAGVPQALEAQLAPGGRLVLPVGDELVRVMRAADGRLERERCGAVRFVPLVSG